MNNTRFDPSAVLLGMKETHRHLLGALLMGVGYWMLASYSRSLAALAGGNVYIWPADGLALGALLCTSLRYWPWYLVVVFVANLLTSYAPPLHNALYALFNVIEPTLVAATVISVLGVCPRINGVKSVAVVVLSIVIVMAPATLFASYINTQFYPKDLMQAWAAWYVPDVLGMLIVGMLVAGVAHEWRFHWENLSRARLSEGLLILAGLIGATHLFFAVLPYAHGVWLDLAATPMLGPTIFMLWGAIRFGLTGAVVAVAILALQTYTYTAHGIGPMAIRHPDPRLALLHLQALLVISDLFALTIAVVSVERRLARNASEASRKRLEFAIHASDILVFEADPSTQKLFWSGDTLAVFGRPAREVANMDGWLQRIHADDRDHVEKVYGELTRGVRASASFDCRLSFDGSEWMSLGVSAYSVPVKDRWFTEKIGEARVVGFVKNVTEKLRLENEKRLLEERLRQSEKMDAIGGLAGGIAHDFNNILGAILGYAEMSQGEVPPGSEVRRYLDTIAAAGERGKALVAQILTFSRVNRAEVSPIDIKELVEEVMAVLKGSMPSQVRVIEDLPEAAVFVLGNGTHLYQLIMNLAGNAIQAMPSGGELTISMNVIDNTDETALQGGVLARGRFVALAFADQGVGIRADVLPRIFEPFFSTKTRDKGTGLGLAIVHGVVLSHGGAIDVQSEPGKGSRFTVYLPEHTVVAVEGREPSRQIQLGQGESILVVDDEPAMVALAEDILAQLGYEPLGFTSSEEALTAYLAEPARFDAVMTDELMPGMTGTELTAKVREVNRTVPILVVSGFGGEGFEARARETGVSLVLKKPYVKAELATAIATVLSA